VRPRALAELVNTVVDEPAAVQFLRQLLLALQDLNPGKALGLFRREARFVGKTLDRDEALAANRWASATVASVEARSMRYTDTPCSIRCWIDNPMMSSWL